MGHVEIATVPDERLVIMRVHSEDDSQISLALSPEQAYSVCVGIVGALKSLGITSIPFSVKDLGETVH